MHHRFDRFLLLNCNDSQVREMTNLGDTGRPHIEKANQELRAIQFRAVTAHNRLRDDVGRLGTAADTVELRRRIATATQRFGELAQQFREAAESHPAKDSTATQKIVRDFQSLLRSSEQVMGAAKKKEAASLPRTAEAKAVQESLAGNNAKENIEREALLEHQRKQELMQIDGEIKFNESLIEERENGIIEISDQIGEVHQIFQDLAVLVHDQGEYLDDIEANLITAAGRTGQAAVQVARAERSQQKSRNTWCFLMALGAGCLVVLMLVILS